jgi:hypothetical protein
MGQSRSPGHGDASPAARQDVKEKPAGAPIELARRGPGLTLPRMNEDLLKSIHEELVAIRQLLTEANKAAPRSTPARATSGSSSYSTSSGGGADEVIPQPTEIVPNAGDVQVHFGKNNGVPLAKLSERSLSWYATEQPPRLDSSGKPYPARPQETLLRNAARTLWHQNKGTLGQPDAPKAAPAPAPAGATESGAHLSDEENMPF